MQDKVGEIFEGTISGVASFGIFVTLDDLNVDGLVHITELPRDYFHFDPARHALIGERSGRRVPARRTACACASRASTSSRRRSTSRSPTPRTAAHPAVSQPLARGDRPRPPRARR